jgi:hypothetical protein
MPTFGTDPAVVPVSNSIYGICFVFWKDYTQILPRSVCEMFSSSESRPLDCLMADALTGRYGSPLMRL